ncbi:hypothetical protein DSM01_3316 [Leeuwenhoekiella palythoae]|uniref:Transposase DDE domain-containing protein n=1 Tax=Leeuwenhoekiella palythoae TaxID=573501 RepID=A0ABY0CZF3_9FLAO|nr:hypothetical protein DSM01_3316 [Leeuwenhoekiella palythoae]
MIFFTTVLFLGKHTKKGSIHMQLSAIAYNLKKYLKFTQKRAKSGAGMLASFFFAEKQTNKHRYIGFKSSEFRLNPDDPKKKNRLKRLIYVRNVTFYSLVQRLPLLAAGFIPFSVSSLCRLVRHFRV